MIIGARNVIVVSDLHLGHKRANPHGFSDFLQWIKSLEKTPVVYGLDQFSKEFSSPDKLILLGDIFELYDPEDGNTLNVARHVLPVLKDISNLSCEKVYVTGNHDESMVVLDGLQIKKSSIRAYRRHYPSHAGADTLRIGKREYFFLHGHQFDKKIEQIGKWGTLIPSIIFQLQQISQSIFGAKGWGSVVLALFLGLLYLTCRTGVVGNGSLQEIILCVILIVLPFWLPQLVWRIVIPIVRRFITKPKDQNIESLLKKRYYKPEKDIISADFIVFGHTHYPEICKKEQVRKILEKKKPLPDRWKSKGLLNDGGWFKEKETLSNTFLYIDTDHILLLKWNPQEEKPELVNDTSYIDLG